MGLDGHPVLRPQRPEIERGHDGGERRRGCLMPADLEPVGVLTQRIGVVNCPAGEPEDFLLKLAQDFKIGRLTWSWRP